MSLLLHIEAATNVCSVALSRDGVLLEWIDNAVGKVHGEFLVVYVDAILKNHKISAFSLDGVAVSIGPGSYTGLRVGLSTAKGICYATTKPLIALPTLEVLCRTSAEAYGAGWHLAVIDARRMEVYATLLDPNGNVAWGPESWILDGLGSSPDLAGIAGRIRVSGDATEKVLDSLGDSRMEATGIRCSARHLVPMAHQVWESGRFADLAYGEPQYLKEARVTTPVKHRLFGLD